MYQNTKDVKTTESKIQVPATDRSVGPHSKAMRNDAMTIAPRKLKLRLMFFMALAIGTAELITSCNPSVDKAKGVKHNVILANEEANDAKANHAADVTVYKRVTNNRLDANQKEIEFIQTKINRSTSIDRAEYDEIVAGFEQKNKELELRIMDYSPGAIADWQSFKTEFNQDIYELWLDLKNFETENE